MRERSGRGGACGVRDAGQGREHLAGEDAVFTIKVKEVREKVTEGTSALFALTSGATAPDKIIDELKAYDFEIISTNLPEEQENKLREAFAHEG